MNTPAFSLHKTDGRSLRSGFLRSAATYPDAPGLILGERTITYRELDQTARTWAAAIIDSLGRAARRVGVLAYRSEVSYVGALAALCSGAGFVPLNPTFPALRTREMIRLAELDAIIVEKRYAPLLEEALADLPSDTPILIPDGDIGDVISTERSVPDSSRIVLDQTRLADVAPLGVLPPVLESEVAYLLFTSGSTGQPKGVPVTHANVLHFIDVMVERYGITAEDRFSQTFDQTFDLSVFDLFVAWERGACVCAMQPIELIAPGRSLRKHGVTIWFSVPSIPMLMLKKNLLKPDSIPTLRWSLFCGEPLTKTAAEAWQAAAPQSTVENLYGPTELTIACFLYRWDPERSPDECLNDIVPIGQPYPGLGALVLNEERQPVSRNEPGELYVCGPQTVPGYWRDPAKTAERFFELPVESAAASSSLRFYATGDRVQQLASGDYAYLGRVDHQVKVLGHRVELGEIEAVLRRMPGVIEAVACAWPIADGIAQGIAAFVTGDNLNPDELKASSRKLLPDYMSPRTVHHLAQMPLNVNGKVDRNTLLARLVSLHQQDDASSRDKTTNR